MQGLWERRKQTIEKQVFEIVVPGMILGLGSVFDYLTRGIPIWLLGTAGGVGIISMVMKGFSFLSLVTGLVPGAILLIIGKLTREAIGTGDGVLIMTLGLFLGAERVLYLLFTGLCLAGVCAVGIVIFTKRPYREIPFVPCLLMAFLLFVWSGSIV